MRWSASTLAIALAVCACSTPPVDPACTPADSYLTYATFGRPFMEDWCTSCHSQSTFPNMRGGAPDDVNLDTLDEVRLWGGEIEELAAHGSDMPPAGGPTPGERRQLAIWLTCGAR
nr:hypothetical protein [Kofleriaceae bacterium]